ncbi:MAG: hypothetical protein J3T61_00430 [Candidatus Brocadiales bacterium]|nr:hypothetical protein [Candidatus Bathyanammoxibius sp.]
MADKFVDLYTDYAEVMGWDTNQDAFLTRSKRHVNWGMRRFLLMKFWKMQQEIATFATVAGTKQYDAPSDVGDNPNAIAAIVDTNNNRKLIRLQMDQMIPLFPDWDDEGAASHYMTWVESGDDDGPQIYLKPIPDSVVTMRVYYWRSFPDMVGDTDEPGGTTGSPGSGRFYEDARWIIPIAAAIWFGRLRQDDPLRDSLLRDLSRGIRDLKGYDELVGDYIPGFSGLEHKVTPVWDPLGGGS